MPKGKTVTVGNIPANIAVDGDKVVADVTTPITLDAPNLATTPTTPIQGGERTPAQASAYLQSDEAKITCHNIRMSCDAIQNSLFMRLAICAALTGGAIVGMFGANFGPVPWFAVLAIFGVIAIVAWMVAYAILWMLAQGVYWLTASKIVIALIPVIGLGACQNTVGWAILLTCMVMILWMRAWLGRDALGRD